MHRKDYTIKLALLQGWIRPLLTKQPKQTMHDTTHITTTHPQFTCSTWLQYHVYIQYRHFWDTVDTVILMDIHWSLDGELFSTVLNAFIAFPVLGLPGIDVLDDFFQKIDKWSIDISIGSNRYRSQQWCPMLRSDRRIIWRKFEKIFFSSKFYLGPPCWFQLNRWKSIIDRYLDQYWSDRFGTYCYHDQRTRLQYISTVN